MSNVQLADWIPSIGFFWEECCDCLILPISYWSHWSIRIAPLGSLKCWLGRRHMRVRNFYRPRNVWWRHLWWIYRIFTKDIVPSDIDLSNFPNGHHPIFHISYTFFAIYRHWHRWSCLFGCWLICPYSCPLFLRVRFFLNCWWWSLLGCWCSSWWWIVVCSRFDYNRLHGISFSC